MTNSRPAPHDQAEQRATIAVAGAGPYADAWARALRAVDGVEIVRLVISTDDALQEQLARPQIDAVAVLPTDALASASDLAAAIRRVMMTGRHVLVAGSVGLGSAQLIALDELARRRERIIMFEAVGVGDERIAFVRKMTAGPHALWRQRYIRSLRTGTAVGDTLDGIAIADISTVLSLAGGLPARIAAVAPRLDDENGTADAVMATLLFEGGAIARIDVSLVEPVQRQEIAIACDGRTILLDALDLRAPLQIQAKGGHGGPQRAGKWAETISEHPITGHVDSQARTATAFVDAIRACNVGATNARALAQAALVWEVCRQSISRGGETLSLPASSPLVETRRPTLQLIHGGGKAAAVRSVPALTLVQREESPRTA